MRHKKLTWILVLPLLMMVTGCQKDYFSELKHPIAIEGAFDPVYGIPLAKMTANMEDLVGLVDTNQQLAVYIGEDGIVTFRYDYYERDVLTWVAEKGRRDRKDGEEPLLRNYYTVIGTERIDLFDKLREYDTHSYKINEFIVSLNTDVQGFVNSSFQEILAEGCNLSFDSLVLTINCLDGYEETLPLEVAADSVTVTELLETRHLELLKKYNLRQLVEHGPSSVSYSVRMCVSLPPDQMLPGSTFQEQINYIGVDSIVADINARIEMPLNFYSAGMVFVDTLDLNIAMLENYLNRIDGDTLRGENYTVCLNEENCYLAFVVKNSLPVDMILDATLLDREGMPIVNTLLDGEYTLAAAPVVPLPGHDDTYVSNGTEQSQFKLPLSLDKLKRLGDAKRIAYRVRMNTSRPATAGGTPYVAVRDEDHLDIRTYVVLSPHADFSIPVEFPSLNN